MREFKQSCWPAYPEEGSPLGGATLKTKKEVWKDKKATEGKKKNHVGLQNSSCENNAVLKKKVYQKKVLGPMELSCPR